MFVPSQCLNFTLVCLIKLCTLGDLCVSILLLMSSCHISHWLKPYCAVEGQFEGQPESSTPWCPQQKPNKNFPLAFGLFA